MASSELPLTGRVATMAPPLMACFFRGLRAMLFHRLADYHALACRVRAAYQHSLWSQLVDILRLTQLLYRKGLLDDTMRAFLARHESPGRRRH